MAEDDFDERRRRRKQESEKLGVGTSHGQPVPHRCTMPAIDLGQSNTSEVGMAAKSTCSHTISISKLLVIGDATTTKSVSEAKTASAKQAPEPNRRQQDSRNHDTPCINCKKKTCAHRNSDKKADPAWDPNLHERVTN